MNSIENKKSILTKEQYKEQVKKVENIKKSQKNKDDMINNVLEFFKKNYKKDAIKYNNN